MSESENTIGDEIELDEIEQDARDEIIRLACTEGLRVAYDASVEIAADKSAAKQARTAAARTILDVAGLINNRGRHEERKSKDPSQMDGDELRAAVAKAQANLTRLARVTGREPRSTKPQNGSAFD